MKFSNFCFLDSNGYDFDKSYDCIAGCGSIHSIICNEKNNISSLAEFINESKDWLFGHVSYDLKNEIENLSSNNKDGIDFPDFYFFVPQIIFILSKETVNIGIHGNADSDAIFEEIISIIPQNKVFEKPTLKSRLLKEEYVETIEKLQQHILRGDCYEICFCHEHYAQNIEIDTVNVFKRLTEISPNPFAAFYKLDQKYLLCASPERFLKKTGDVLISQPIKGTSKRTYNNTEDEKYSLRTDAKERAENIMIVDLVRNDLSKICTEGSVSVKEFLKVYSFPQVHQMISTIEGKLGEKVSFGGILSATFPMGSMTGAPKKRVMEVIEKYEKTKRGLFSGTVGYINPDGDFDFNVVIRSILYNEANRYLSIQAGSAITSKSRAEKEYEECNLKMEAMVKALI
jgi:para-aminobenzoate synthetase component I